MNSKRRSRLRAVMKIILPAAAAALTILPVPPGAFAAGDNSPDSKSSAPQSGDPDPPASSLPPGLFSLPAGTIVPYPPPPQRLTTTLNIDGSPQSIALLGTTYKGVRLIHIGVNSIMRTAGLQLEDILLSLNDQITTSTEQAEHILSQLPSGDLNIGFARTVDGQLKIMESRIRYLNPLRAQKRGAFIQQAISHGMASAAESTEPLEARLVELINADRRNAPGLNLSPLKANPELSKLAHEYAVELVREGRFADRDSKGHDLTYRAGSIGLSSGVTENAASGMKSPEEAEAYFMNQPPDNPGASRTHILNPKSAYLGVGVARTDNGSLVVIELFSTQKP